MLLWKVCFVFVLFLYLLALIFPFHRLVKYKIIDTCKKKKKQTVKVRYLELPNLKKKTFVRFVLLFDSKDLFIITLYGHREEEGKISGI